MLEKNLVKKTFYEKQKVYLRPFSKDNTSLFEALYDLHWNFPARSRLNSRALPSPLK